jgi:hypothetical protein
MFLIITVVVFVLAFYYIVRGKKLTKNKTNDINILLVAVVFVCGLTIYMIGYYDTGTKEQMVTLLARSIVSSIRMFFSFSDITDVRQSMLNNQYFMLAFSVTNLLALMMSSIVIIQMFWQRISSYLKYRFGMSKNESYIFFEINDASIALARSIKKEKKEKAYVLFIVSKNRNKEHDENNREIGADDGGFIIVEKEYSTNSSLEEMGVSRILNRSKKCYMFFLTNDETFNLKLSSKIKDGIGQRGQEVNLYVMYTSVQDEKNFMKLAKVEKNNGVTVKSHYFNSAELTSMDLIVKYPPVKYIGIDIQKAVAEEDFNVMIIGFGEIGQHVLRYLIEQGQFVGSNFHATVIDENMDAKEGIFQMRYPGLANYKIEYVSLKIDSKEYVEYLKKHIMDVKYVVVALGSDSKNIDVALDVDELMKKGIGMEKRNIFINLKGENNLLCTKQFRNNYKNIKVFGKNSEIFGWDNIVQDKIIEGAKKLNEIYNADAKGHGKKWDDLESIKKIQSISSVMHLPTKLALVGLKPKDKDSVKVEEELPNEDKKSCFDKFLSKENERRENFLKTEQLRWNATYFVHGWQTLDLSKVKDKESRRDEDAERHACLVDWEQLKIVSDKLGEDYREKNSIAFIECYDEVGKTFPKEKSKQQK